MKTITELNCNNAQQRLENLAELIKSGLPERQVREKDANNHIHTFYSFSPYSPTLAAYLAYASGLTSSGIMDHDTLAGAEEFRLACAMLNLGCTCGVEVRAKLAGNWGRINNPDQDDCIYMSAYGVPPSCLAPFNDYLSNFRTHRHKRNEIMCGKINSVFEKFGICLDYQKDVCAISRAAEGGSVTERHLLYALSCKLEETFSRSMRLANFLSNELNMSLSQKEISLICQQNNDYFLYDLLGILKSRAEFFYVDADEELPSAEDFTATALKFGAIPTYAYLGDVGDSVTGDKRAQKFEDSFLDELLLHLKKIGVKAVTYMPTRNNMQQLTRLKALCAKLNLFEISGEDINSPRQKFACEKLSLPEFQNLIDSTWALIGHEFASDKNIDNAMFAEKTENQYPKMEDRIEAYAKIGRNTVK